MKARRVRVANILPVRIIADGIIASRGVGGGRMVPLVIVDSTQRPEVNEIVRLHEHLPPGDATTQWGTRVRTRGKIALFLHFSRPMSINLLLEFGLPTQAGLVDQIITAKCLYLQPGSDGDRLAATLDSPRILIEMPSTGFENDWEQILHSSIAADLRQKGLPRRDSREAAKEFVQEWRKQFGGFRMR